MAITRKDGAVVGAVVGAAAIVAATVYLGTDGTIISSPGGGGATTTATATTTTTTTTTSAPTTTTIPGASGDCTGIFPDATCTGVPAGTVLTNVYAPVDDAYRVRTDGQIVEDMYVHGCILVQAHNVTIRRVRVDCPFWGGIINDDSEAAPLTGLVIQDTEVSCNFVPGSSGVATGYGGATVQNVNIHSCENGMDVGLDALIEDNYIHDLFPFGTADTGHSDGIQSWQGTDVIIRHNTILVPGGTSAIITGNRSGGTGTTTNQWIDHNLLGGGAVALYCPLDHVTGFKVTDNRFTTIFTGTVGEFGPMTGCAHSGISVFSGNVLVSGGAGSSDSATGPAVPAV